MQLALDRASTWAVQRLEADGIVVAGVLHQGSFAIGPLGLIEPWTPASVAALCPADLDRLLAVEPDVILLGTGAKLCFPAPALGAYVLSRRVGFEVMDNAAAARTYNVLLSEGRKVVVAFMLGDPSTSLARG